MHPTRDTLAVININLVGGRVMPGVRQPTLRKLATVDCVPASSTFDNCVMIGAVQ
jgi:hypothetical protein